MNYSKIEVFITGTVLTLTVLLFARHESWSGEKKKYALEKVIFAAGQSLNTNTLPIELGIRQGIYRKEGVDMEFLTIKGIIAMAGLRTGQLDYTMHSGTGLRSAALGLPIKAVMALSTKTAMSLVGRPGINSVKDLKGKIVGVGTAGDTMDYAARAVLTHHGLTPEKDVTIREVGVGALSYLALKNGVIDAGIMNVIHVLKLIHEEKKGFKELMQAGEVMKGVSNAIQVSDARLKENPLQIKKVIRGTLRSMAYVRDNNRLVIDNMVKDFGLGREISSLLYERARDNYNYDGRAPDENFEAEMKLAKEKGFVPANKEVPLSQLRDFSLLEEVLKEMGIK